MQHHTTLRTKLITENKSFCYQDEEHDQRKNVEQQGPKYTLEDCQNLAHEAQTWVGKAKTKIIIEPKMDGDNCYIDIWKDHLSMKLLVDGSLDINACTIVDIERAKKKVMRYHQQMDTIYIQNLIVLKLDNVCLTMKNMHNEIGHFGEARMLVEIKKWVFQHDRTHYVKEFVKVCDRCQLAKQTSNMRSIMEGMKSIPMCDLFY